MTMAEAIGEKYLGTIQRIWDTASGQDQIRLKKETTDSDTESIPVVPRGIAMVLYLGSHHQS
jgi:hypothetical protein